MDIRGAVVLEEGVARDLRTRSEVANLIGGATTLREGLNAANALLAREDRNWSLLNKLIEDDDGMSIENLKEWSDKIRNSVIGAPWIGRGFRLRQTFIWQGNIRYGNIPEPKQGRKSIKALIDDPTNQREFFSHSAHIRREGCCYHDGIAAWIGNDSTHKLRALPLSDITDVFRDPENRGRIWAFRREWMQRDPSKPKGEPKVMWYFTNDAWDYRVDTITHGGKDEPVAQDERIFYMSPNKMEGFALGAPDAIAAYVWNSIARDAYMDGITMTSALATFAFKASVSSKPGATGAALKIADATGAGQTAVLGATNDLTAMPQAGKGYDFQNLRDLTAVIAASLDVSNTALTANASGGGSYGSENALDMPTRLAMESRRLEHIELDIEVLKWLGVAEPVAYFKTLTAATEIFREAQALLLLWSSGLYRTGPLEKRLSDLMQIVGNEVPDGVLIPNNQKSWERADIDPSNDPSASGATGNQTSAVGKPNSTPPGQGQNSPAGKGQNANDIRTEFLSRLEKFGAMLDELEAASRGAIAA